MLLHSFTADQDSFSGVNSPFGIVATGIIQVKSIALGHDPERLFTDWCRPLVLPRPRQVQQGPLQLSDDPGTFVTKRSAYLI